MATFKFSRTVDIHWNGYDIVGPAETVFSIPDQLYEEFDADIAPVEPTLVWIDTNEFLTLSNSVSVSQLNGTFPISVTTTTSGKLVAISSSTNPAGYTMVADGSGGVIFQAGSTGALTSLVGVSPISTIISGNTASVLLNANYQTAGTYVTGVSGTAPITASGTTSITVGIDQAALSVSDAATASTLRTYVKNSSGSTITKGQAVYVTGADGTNALIGLASASTDATSSKTLGIVANTMTNNEFGYVIENGQLSNIDTSAASAGSSIWLGATPGSIVFDTPPAEPNHAVYLGVVTKANVSTGEILVKVQNGYELNELHDVFTTGVSTSLPLVYNAASDGWVAQALTSVGIATGAIGSAQIAAGAVGSAQIAAGAVGSTQLAVQAIPMSTVTTAGDIIYATGSAAVSRLALGTAGKVLTVNSGATAPEWATAASGGGLTLIATATPSAATTISFTSIPNTYKHLMLIWTGMFQSVTGEQFYVRLNNDTAAVYDYNGITATGSTISDGTSADATGFGQLNGSTTAPIALTASSASDLTKTSNGVMMIYRYTDTGDRHVEWSQTSYRTAATAGYIWNNMRGVYSPTSGSAVDRVDFIRAATQTITGTMYLYGVS